MTFLILFAFKQLSDSVRINLLLSFLRSMPFPSYLTAFPDALFPSSIRIIRSAT